MPSKCFTAKSSFGNGKRKLRRLTLRLFQHFHHSLKMKVLKNFVKRMRRTKLFHLDYLADKFIGYFPDNFSANPIHKLTCNPFWQRIDINVEVLQEQALEMK
ncbi:unnamed protein product [Caretta caretta]